MIRLPALPVLALLLAFAPAARAAEPYDNCTGYIDVVPAVISTQGTWCLRKDLATPITSGSAITVATNNVTLDCNDFKVGGLGAGLATATAGIEASARKNITVRNCNLRGFYRGIYSIGAAANHLIVDNRLDGSRQAGILLAGKGHVVRGNVIVDTGGTPIDATANGIFIDGDADVIDNTVDGVIPTTSETQFGSNGILLIGSSVSVVRGNRVRNIDGGELPARAIALFPGFSGSAFATVEGNQLAAGATGASGATGIYCDPNQLETVTNNRILGFLIGVNGCDNDGGNIIKI